AAPATRSMKRLTSALSTRSGAGCHSGWDMLCSVVARVLARMGLPSPYPLPARAGRGTMAGAGGRAEGPGRARLREPCMKSGRRQAGSCAIVQRQPRVSMFRPNFALPVGVSRPSAPVLAALLMTAQAVVFAGMTALIRYAAQNLHPFEVSFFR